MIPDTVNPGERIGWRTLNGYAAGIIVSNDDRGVFVRCDNGKAMILSTERSMRFANEERKRRQEALMKSKTNL